jgi:hypothetical protein
VQALRRKGVEAQLVVFNRGRLHPEADLSLDRPRGFVARQAIQLSAQIRLLPKADIFHFYFGLTLVPKSLQFPLLRATGRRSVYHFLGSDIRGRSPTELAFANRADARIVGNYDDRRWLPSAEVVLPGVDFRDYPHLAPSNASRPLVVHAPSNRSKKGTDADIAACAALPVELEIIEGLPQNQARQRYAAADIVVDQLKVGWYGVFAIEAMALGKPVICYLHDDALRETERAFKTNVPVISATSDTLQHQLQALVQSSDLRRQVGAASRTYAEKLHDVDQIADQPIAIYKQDQLTTPAREKHQESAGSSRRCLAYRPRPRTGGATRPRRQDFDGVAVSPPAPPSNALPEQACPSASWRWVKSPTPPTRMTLIRRGQHQRSQPSRRHLPYTTAFSRHAYTERRTLRLSAACLRRHGAFMLSGWRSPWVACGWRGRQVWSSAWSDCSASTVTSTISGSIAAIRRRGSRASSLCEVVPSRSTC